MTMLVRCVPPCAPTQPVKIASSDCFPCAGGGGGVDPFALAVTCPTIPATAVVSSPDLPGVRVLGQNFTTATEVFLDNVAQPTTFVHTGELTFTIQPSLYPTPATATITVKDGTTVGIGTCQFSFTAAPVLTVTCPLVPATAVISTPNILTTVNGQLFTAASEVLWDGVAQATTFVNANQLTFMAPTSTEAVARTANVTVRDTGVTAATVCPFEITATAVLPIVNELRPACLPIDSATQPVVLVVVGEKFTATSVVLFDGAPQTTVFINATMLQVNVTTGAKTQGQVQQVTVDNGGAVSTPALPLTFWKTPTITDVVQKYYGDSDPASEMTITGTNFDASSVVYYDLNPIPTTYVSATEVKAQRDPAIVGTGTALVYVSTCNPVSIISSPAFNIQCVPNPVLNRLEPTTGPAGTVVTIYANGAGAGTDAEALIGSGPTGVPQPTTMNGNLVTFVIPAGAAGTIDVSVRIQATVYALTPPSLPFIVV